MRIFAEILTRIFTKPRFLLALKLYIHIIIYIKNIFNLNTLREQRGKHSTVLVFPSFHAQPLMRKIDQDEVSHASGSFSCKSSPRFIFLITSNGSVLGLSASHAHKYLIYSFTIPVFLYGCRQYARYSYHTETTDRQKK